MIKQLLLAFPLAMLAACGGGSSPEHDKMMADHTAMLAADSANTAATDQMKQAAQRFLDTWWSGKSDGLEEIVAENFTSHMSIPGVTSTGIQQLKDLIAISSATFTDNKMEDLHMTAEGDRVIAHYRWKGKNTGSMGEGMPATNAPVDVNCVDILRFENGKAVEHWGNGRDEDDAAVRSGLKMILRAPPGPFAAILRCSTLTERPAMRGFRALADREMPPARSRKPF